MTLTPLFGRIVIQRESSEKQTQGGIIIPDNAQKQSQKGTVLAVYEDYEDEAGKLHRCRLNAGESVVFQKYGGEEFILNSSDKVLLIREMDILGVLRESPAEDVRIAS
jgi:chaperonin GroES